MPFHTDDLENL